MKRTLLFILVLSLVFSLGLSAYADVSANHIINSKTDKTDKAVSQQASKSDLGSAYADVLKASDVQQLPKNSSYLETSDTMYMDSGNISGAHAYKKPYAKAGKIANVFQGTRVSVIAVEGDWCCGVFNTEKHEIRAGWFYYDNLSFEYPGEEYIFGQFTFEEEIVIMRVQPELEWSRQNFVDSDFKYCNILKPYSESGCLSLTIDYQVTDYGTKNTAYGEREVYYNSGDGWVYAGCFDLAKELPPVHCVLRFEEPTIVKAVAVIPTNTSADEFDFRMSVVDIEYPYM